MRKGPALYDGAPRSMKMALLVLHSAMIMEPALHSNLRYCDGRRFRATPHPGGLRLRRTSFAAAALKLAGSRPESSCQTTLIVDFLLRPLDPDAFHIRGHNIKTFIREVELVCCLRHRRPELRDQRVDICYQPMLER